MLSRRAVPSIVALVAVVAVAGLVATVAAGSPETAFDVLDPSVIEPSLFARMAEVAGSLPVVALAVIGIAATSGSWRSAAAVVAVAALAEVVTAAIKALVDRPRPSAIAYSEVIGSASFPSGHVVRTAVAVGLALMVVPWARRHPLLAMGIGIGFVVGMAIGRVAAGAHHTSDVIAGLLVAAGVLAAVALARSTGASRAWRALGPTAMAIVVIAIGTGAVHAATPTPAPMGGDPRVPDGGASFMGEPVIAIVATLIVGVGAAIGTMLYVRLTPGRGASGSADRDKGGAPT